jgi:hypothetical protein
MKIEKVFGSRLWMPVVFKIAQSRLNKVVKGDFLMMNKARSEYEVLSPWADADPIPFKGITPRIGNLEGKKIGLLRNSKRAAAPLMKVIEKKLKEKFPTAEFTQYANLIPNERMIDQDKKDEFENWLKGVDAVIATFGD